MNNCALIVNNCSHLIDPFSSTDYVYDYFVKKRNFNIFESLYRIARKLHLIKSIPHYYSWNSWKKNIKKYDYWILFNDTDQINEIAAFIKNKNPNAKILFYCWDIHHIITDSTNADATAYFDKILAEKYNSFYLHQFYNNNILYQKLPEIYSYFWIGREKKERESELKKIKNYLSDISNGYWNTLTSAKPDMDYAEEYLKLLQQSKIIVEVTQNSQEGLTLRTMESIFYEKKLITNNTSILKYNFYKPENIFIIGIDSDIHSWLQIPYAKIDNSIKMEYTLNKFIENSKNILK